MSYYRAALFAAKQRNFTVASRLSLVSILTETEKENAEKLLEICNEALCGSADLGEIRALVVKRKFRAARRLARKLPGSVMKYNLLGCLSAINHRNKAAIRAFAEARTLDTGNETAAAALESLSGRGWNKFAV
ncbi:MAG: hypothetical protein LBQ48_04045 [Oscillospiraceae bacterium]|jgi:hypothetical protein|nr:hypothetical protein [Oscillospiraceae bacterium]